MSLMDDLYGWGDWRMMPNQTSLWDLMQRRPDPGMSHQPFDPGLVQDINQAVAAPGRALAQGWDEMMQAPGQYWEEALRRDLGRFDAEMDRFRTGEGPSEEFIAGMLDAATPFGAVGSVVRKTANMVLSPDGPISKQQAHSAVRDRLVQNLEREGGRATGASGVTESAPWQARPYDPATVGAYSDSLRGLVKREYDLSPDLASGLNEAGQATPRFIELKDTPQGRKYFKDSIEAGKTRMGDIGAAVDVKDSYAGTRMFVTESGQSGFAVTPDGDVVSVFRTGDDPRGIAPQMVSLATQEGGRKLDAFDTALPRIYNEAGYEDVARTGFNREYSPPGWNYEKMGEPDVAAMVFRPGEITPYQRGLTETKVPEYDQIIGAQQGQIWTPELTPGVMDQLQSLSARGPKAGTRTTVKSPTGKNYPGIYKPQEQLIEEGARMVAPENPLMREMFGVNRQDLDDLTRQHQAQMARENVEIPTWQTTDRGAQHVYNIMTPSNVQRLQDTLALGAADPRFAGSYGWYWNEPLKQRYQQLWGPEEGARRFDQFMQHGSVMSAGAPVPLEIRRASMMDMLANEGREGDFLAGNLTSGENLMKTFPGMFDDLQHAGGYGHIYHRTAHVPGLQRMSDTGRFFDEAKAMEAPKTPNYYYSKTGENIMWPTADAHFVRGTGLADVRSGKDTGGSINKGETGRVREFFRNEVANPLGMEGSPAQALMWNVLAPQTGVKTQVGKPYLELMTDAAEREAKRRGITPQQALDEFILGRGRLGMSVPGAVVGGGLYGLLDEESYV